MHGSRIHVLALNGSARKGGNTSILLRHVLRELERQGIETELVEMAGMSIHGCRACGACGKLQNCHCARTDDMANELIDKMVAADGILLGSPTYVADVSPEIKALMDRACCVAKANNSLFRHKVGAAVVVARRAGAISTFDSLNRFFLISEMIIPGSSYWNVAYGRAVGDVEEDEEGVRTMQTLGRNMAWLLERIKAPARAPEECVEIVSQ